MYRYVEDSVLQYSTDFRFYYKQSWGPKNAHQVPAPRFSPPKIFLILVVRSKSWPASYLFFWHLQPWLNISNISTVPRWVSLGTFWWIWIPVGSLFLSQVPFFSISNEIFSLSCRFRMEPSYNVGKLFSLTGMVLGLFYILTWTSRRIEQLSNSPSTSFIPRT